MGEMTNEACIHSDSVCTGKGEMEIARLTFKIRHCRESRSTNFSSVAISTVSRGKIKSSNEDGLRLDGFQHHVRKWGKYVLAILIAFFSHLRAFHGFKLGGN